MLFWLTRAARDARIAAGRLQVHVAASANVNQSTIDRFEKGGAWPRDTDRFVNAYADDLDIEPVQLWDEALRLWREHLADRDGAATIASEGQRAVRDLADAAGTTARSPRAPSRRRRAAS